MERIIKSVDSVPKVESSNVDKAIHRGIMDLS